MVKDNDMKMMGTDKKGYDGGQDWLIPGAGHLPCREAAGLSARAGPVPEQLVSSKRLAGQLSSFLCWRASPQWGSP